MSRRAPTDRTSCGSLRDSHIRSSTSLQGQNRKHAAEQQTTQHNVESFRLAQGRSDENDDIDHASEVIMAINMTERWVVGCCYYVAMEEKLYFMEDVQLGGPEIVDQLKLSIEPTVVLISTKCDDALINCLDPENRDAWASADGVNADQTRLPYLLECRPHAEFRYDSARNKLLDLRIGQRSGPRVMFVVPGDLVANEGYLEDVDSALAGRHGQLLRLSAWINVESRVTVGCTGAVLAYLQRRRAAAFLPGDPDSANLFAVRTIQMCSSAGTMFINSDTLLSLQILQTESHPNPAYQGPTVNGSSIGSKEGFSVYSLFHPLAKTTQGRNLLKRFFLRPSTNLDVINERLNSIDMLLHPGSADMLDQLRDSLSHIKNMRAVTTDLSKGINCGLDRSRSVATSIWPRLQSFAYYALTILDTFQRIEGVGRLSIYNKIVETFNRRTLATVGHMINEIVDFEAMREQNRTVVLQGVDRELDRVKRTYDGIEDLLAKAADEISCTVPRSLNISINVISFPQIGFLTVATTSIERSDPNMYEGTEADPWERVFTTEKSTYYKNSRMNELDNYFGDIYGQICDREIDIIQDLGIRILEHAEVLNDSSDVCAELDCLCALAEGARVLGFSRPKVRDNNTIKIRGGRHPLQERTVPQYVPNDTFIVGGIGTQLHEEATFQGFGTEDPATLKTSQLPKPSQSRSEGPSMVLMTGPNYSGKSVYLKQVAIITYLAHIGSYVPAESARIGLTDKILTRISTKESASRIQSAFMTDLQQVSLALQLATRRSLLILDEFGKGTESHDGAGLFTAVLEHLLQRGHECPKVLAATHFHEIFEGGFLPLRPALQFAHMEVRVNETASQVDEQVTYLYIYRPWRSNSSFGSYCAAMNGVAPEIVSRAEEFILLMARGQNLVEACARLPAGEMEELTIAEVGARDFLGTNWQDVSEVRKLLESVESPSDSL